MSGFKSFGLIVLLSILLSACASDEHTKPGTEANHSAKHAP